MPRNAMLPITMPDETREQLEATAEASGPKRRSLFRELMSGVEAMREHREGRLTLRTTEVAPITIPPANPELVRQTREALRPRSARRV